MINLYGRFDGWLSHAMVSRGMAYGLAYNGVDFTISNTHRYGGYDGLEELGLNQPQGYQTNTAVGFYIGGYFQQAEPWLQDHQVRVALLIAESAVLPPTWARTRLYDLIVTPSRWVRDAFEQSLRVDPRHLMVVRHGLDPVYRELPAMPAVHVEGPLHFLHVCGAADVLDRKGTPQLLEAWKRVFGPGGVLPGAGKLLLRTVETPQIHAWLSAVGATDAGIILDTHKPGEGLPPAQMRRYYLGDNPLGQIHAVVQPSRAEAFGIVPLEARACAIPVIATACSGQSEHAEDWDTRVEHEGADSIFVKGIPNGVAPGVTADHVADALLRFARTRFLYAKEAFLHSRAYYHRWSWGRQTVGLAKWLNRAVAKSRKQETIASKTGF